MTQPNKPKNDRHLIILAVGALTLVVTIWFFTSFGHYLDKSKFTYSFFPIVFSAPVAYLIWYWRDQNKISDIENEKANVQIRQQTFFLHDFHQIQQWAVGVGDSKSLQVAAIYQLRNYLNGIRGEDFVRPTWEQFRTLLNQYKPDLKLDEHGQLDTTIEESDRHIEAIHNLIREEARKERFRSYFNILISFSNLNLFFADFSNSNFEGVIFHKSNLTGVNFAGTDLNNAGFYRSPLKHAHFNNRSTLNGVYFSNVNLEETLFFDTDFDGVSLNGSKVSAKSLEWTSLKGCKWIDGERIKEESTGEDGRVLIFEDGKKAEINTLIENHYSYFERIGHKATYY